MRLALLLLLVTAHVAHADVGDGRAIVFVVDRGMPADKLERVRLAIKEATYNDGDIVGVVAFGKRADVIVPLNGKTKRRVVTTTEPTNLIAGLEAAQKMLKKSDRSRLAIVMTARDEVTGVEDTIAKLVHDHITVSAIGDDKTALSTIAKAGGGRAYATHELQLSVQKELYRPIPGEETYAYVLVIDRSLAAADLEAMKELARTRAEQLTPNDMLAVITLENGPANVYVKPMHAWNKMRISHDISRITTSGVAANTDAGMREAVESLKNIGTTERHVVLYGPGSNVKLDYIEEMAAMDIVVSAVGLREAARETLTAITKAGRGNLIMLSSGLKMR